MIEPDWSGYGREWANMLVGGNWVERLAYEKLIADHVTGVCRIDPAQWRGWPALVFDSEAWPVGWRLEGVW